MKKTLFIALVLVLGSNKANSQTLLVEDDLGNNISETEFNVAFSGDPDEFEYLAHVYVRNTSATTDYVVNAKRIELDVDCNTSHALCWDVCPPAVNSCTSTILFNAMSRTIKATEADNTGVGHLYPGGSNGISKFRYVFYLDIDNEDSTFIDVVYNHSFLSVDDNVDLKVNFSPNPTSGIVNFTFNNSEIHNVRVVDLLGKVILNENTSSNQSIDLSANKKGVYFVIVSDQKGQNITTQKLILE